MSIRQTEELHDALDQIFLIWPCIDLAFSLPSGAWLRPDAIDGKHRRLAGLDRDGVAAQTRELWARALSGGCGVHWRPAGADAALLDDLDEATALGVTAKYRAVGIETSPSSYQAIIATGRALARIEQHRVQSALVQRLHAAGRHADRGATGAGQYARLPGFPHPGHGGRVVRLLGSSGALLPLLDPDAVLGSGCGTPKPAEAAGRRRASACSRPGVPGRPRSGGWGKAAKDGPADHAGGSERDYAWACSEIRAGADLETLTDRLAAAALARGKRHDEAGAQDYARRTIYKAQAALTR